MVERWKRHYVDYAHLKHLLKEYFEVFVNGGQEEGLIHSISPQHISPDTFFLSNSSQSKSESSSLHNPSGFSKSNFMQSGGRKFDNANDSLMTPLLQKSKNIDDTNDTTAQSSASESSSSSSHDLETITEISGSINGDVVLSPSQSPHPPQLSASSSQSQGEIIETEIFQKQTVKSDGNSSTEISSPFSMAHQSSNDVEASDESTMNYDISSVQLSEKEKALLDKGIAEWEKAFRKEVVKVTQFGTEGVSAMMERVTSLRVDIERQVATRGTTVVLKRAFLDLCVDATELSHFMMINSEGIAKLIKKYRKTVTKQDPQTGKPVCLVKPSSDMLQSESEELLESVGDVPAIIHTIEDLYVSTFSSGKWATMAALGTISASEALKTEKDSQPKKKLISKSPLASKSTTDLFEPEEPIRRRATLVTSSSGLVKRGPESEGGLKQLQAELQNEIHSSTEAQIAWKKNSILNEYLAYQKQASVPAGIVDMMSKGMFDFKRGSEAKQKEKEQRKREEEDIENGLRRITSAKSMSSISGSKSLSSGLGSMSADRGKNGFFAKNTSKLGKSIFHTSSSSADLLKGSVNGSISDIQSTSSALAHSSSSASVPPASSPAAPAPLYFKVKYHWVIIAFVVLLVMGVVPWNKKIATQMRCLGLLAWASILWAFDALPTHITGLMIPVVANWLLLLGGTFQENSRRLVESTISDTPYLAMGGYTIALAMRHTGLDMKIAVALLQFKVARKPVVFLLIATGLEYVLTMVISNISSTVLVLSLVLPVLREVPVKGGFSKMLLLTIAMTGNLAGMACPLASPQSMVGLDSIQKAIGEHSKINFGTWTIGALPVTLVSTIVCFLFLFLFYKIDIKEVPYTPAPKEPWTLKQIVVAVVSLITIVFWFIIPYAPFLGNEALVGLIPVCVFFGFNLVPRTDIAELPWNMILLVMGGGALGESIKSSHLLDLISELFGPTFSSLNLFVQLLILTAIVAFVSIFVSHTVAAIVLIPIVNSVMGDAAPHIELVLMACALHVSPPMLLSVASFPNMSCFAVENSKHESYLTPKDFFKYGGVVTIVSFVLINTIFYGTGLLMKL